MNDPDVPRHDPGPDAPFNPDFLRYVLDSLPEGCQVIGFDWRYLYVNEAAAAHGRTTREALVGRTMAEVYPAIDQTPMFAMLRETMTRRTSHRFENEFVYPDGRTAWFELRFVPVPEGVFILSLDITSRRAREGERQQLAMAISESAEAVVITDLQGRVTYVNPAFELITGYRREEVLGRNTRFLRGNASSPAFYEEMWQTVTAHRTWRGRIVNHRKDGTPYAQDTSISPVHDSSGALVSFVSVGRDVTNAIRLETQLQQTQRLETIGRLAGGIAHDFNNLLSVIISYADVLISELPPGDRQREDIEEIRNAGHRAAGLTRQLLTFSRQQVLQPEVMNLNEAVTRMESMLRRLIGEDIDILTALAPDLGSIRADPGQVEQVIMNLVVNARDAMPEGGHLTIGTTNLHLDDPATCERLGIAPGHYVVLSVADTGCGMDLETRARLFEPFFTTKGPGRGTGLGLPTVYGIVRQSGGAISVYTEVAQGSTFKLYFPRELAEVPETALVRQPAGLARPGETVLVVEDEAAVRQIAERILRHAGYRVLSAGNGDEALALAEAEDGRIDILLTDVVMPRMSGRELAGRMLERFPALSVLFMSGYTDDAIVHHGVLNRETAFISKPFSTVDLTRKIRELLDHR